MKNYIPDYIKNMYHILNVFFSIIHFGISILMLIYICHHPNDEQETYGFLFFLNFLGAMIAFLVCCNNTHYVLKDINIIFLSIIFDNCIQLINVVFTLKYFNNIYKDDVLLIYLYLFFIDVFFMILEIIFLVMLIIYKKKKNEEKKNIPPIQDIPDGFHTSEEIARELHPEWYPETQIVSVPTYDENGTQIGSEYKIEIPEFKSENSENNVSSYD